MSCYQACLFPKRYKRLVHSCACPWAAAVRTAGEEGAAVEFPDTQIPLPRFHPMRGCNNQPGRLDTKMIQSHLRSTAPHDSMQNKPTVLEKGMLLECIDMMHLRHDSRHPRLPVLTSDEILRTRNHSSVACLPPQPNLTSRISSRSPGMSQQLYISAHMCLFAGMIKDGRKTKYDVQKSHKSWAQPLSLTNLYKILDKRDLGRAGLCTFTHSCFSLARRPLYLCPAKRSEPSFDSPRKSVWLRLLRFARTQRMAIT